MMFLTDLRPMNNLFANAAQNPLRPNAPEPFTPRVSLYEAKEAFWVRMEIPGVPAEQIELTFERDELTVRGEKTRETLSEDEARWIRNERAYGKFERTFKFATPVAADQVQAETRDGILTIRIAKAPESLPKKINVVAK